MVDRSRRNGSTKVVTLYIFQYTSSGKITFNRILTSNRYKQGHFENIKGHVSN